ncbi:MAG: hypothetical protein R8G01_21505 [Ilumatobacteraceae bacterium]|nr:hypothetical protein [Ilumatobacteraceae bacterium]
MLALWVVALVVGVVGASYGSRRAVTGALAVADEMGWSKGLIGATLVAIGTDLPEIANSISASLTGHGDLIVGDATGSALTQITLILAILVVAAAKMGNVSQDTGTELAVAIGALTVVACLGIAWAVSDGELGRFDGLLLVSFWVSSVLILGRWQRETKVVPDGPRLGLGRAVAMLMGWLAVVGAAATLVVRSFVELTDAIGVPELVASTVVLALGTSLPELVVDWTAIRRGATALAFGDIFGSSLVDASLSIGIGPLFRSTEVSGDAVTSVLIVAAGVALATYVWRRQRTSTQTALQLATVYVVCIAALIVWAPG